MPTNTPKDVKTDAYVLRRTNYGEADRILNLITPEGKVSAIAKGVRKPLSKLAGSVELLTLFEANLHFGKSDLAILTGARMQRYYANIVKDYTRMTMASVFLKEINRAAEHVENPELFEILDKCLFGLDSGYPGDLVYAWFFLNLKRAMGEQLNLYMDVNGVKLEEDKKYIWDGMEMAFQPKEDGEYEADFVKVLRLMVSADLEVVFRIKDIEKYLPGTLEIVKTL
ncbi:DNA repair protein RecO [Candidatus Saccharibacteria bacterium]|nr:DNA repair protein RecO [Candidatus Saccharibacteria bacterium]